ncbi:D-alanyl-D-alanine carboxypeptidase [Patescibacteria group bacterium]|nr:MAG: D-alanyl-D-alanine carboxypeptidase [Patescibacteria group bacterium]
MPNMQVLLSIELLVFGAVALLTPFSVVAPVAAETGVGNFSPAAFHSFLRAPPSRLNSLPLARARVQEPLSRDVRELGPVVAARGALVLDRATGALLYEKDSERLFPIASLTKLMTALVFLDFRLDWNTRVAIRAGDLRGGGVEYFVPGETVTGRDLFFTALVGSSNTAAAALARSTGVSPEEFTKRMNDKAAALKMSSAYFADPTGLDERNVGSGRDVALLSEAAFRSPAIVRAVTSKSYTFIPQNSKKKKRTIRSTDLLLVSALNSSPYRILGGKTGTLGEKTGYHLALSVRSEETGRDFIIVVLGSETNASRFADAKTLAVWSFDAYEWPETRAVAAN